MLLLKKHLKNLNQIFLSSFDDAHLSNLLEVQSNKPIDFLEDNKELLISNIISENGQLKYYYKIESKNKNEVLELRSKIQQIENIESIEIKLSN